MIRNNKINEVQYVGVEGSTACCKRAIISLVHCGIHIKEVKIITDEGRMNTHAFIITTEHNVIAVKGGFTSGYPGEGPRGYSYVLALLSNYTQNIDEYIVSSSIFERLNECQLTAKDIARINSTSGLSPARWYEQIIYHPEESSVVFNEFPLTLPLALIDERLIEIALTFSENPDNAILKAYRKIESIVKSRTKLDHESGTKLFKKAFLGDNSILFWKSLDSGEAIGRANLFASTFMAYRNKRAHQEPTHRLEDDIREFMLINQLFFLERESLLRDAPVSEGVAVPSS